MYWSDAVVLNRTQVAAVVVTSPPVECTRRIRAEVRRSRKWPASITPPKIIAVTINQTVFSIPAIPFEVNRASTAGSPVFIEMVPYIALVMTR